MSVAATGHGPLTVPVWYTYEPGGAVSVITGGSSVKATLLRREGRFSLCAQTETAPYKYVSVEGSIQSVEDRVDPDERRSVAHRYLGEQIGDMYIASTEAEAADNIVVRMRPERWYTVDYAKQFG
jgi:hypothetical protein